MNWTESRIVIFDEQLQQYSEDATNPPIQVPWTLYLNISLDTLIYCANSEISIQKSRDEQEQMYNNLIEISK
jgi:hypothetical protein